MTITKQDILDIINKLKQRGVEVTKDALLEAIEEHQEQVDTEDWTRGLY